MTVREAKTCVHGTCTDERQARIRRLNDDLRRYGRGGTICVTRGVQALGGEALATILAAMHDFEEFTPGNDPYGEHDWYVFKAAGERLMWKIDYYDVQRRHGSPDPSDPTVTSRVLTIMLASEY